MKRRTFLMAATASSVALVGCGGGTADAAGATQPNDGGAPVPPPGTTTLPPPSVPPPPSSSPPPPSPTASSALWGTDYAYSAPIWTVTNRAGSPIWRGARVSADFAGSIYNSKHTNGFFRSVDNRVWHGWGDARAFPSTNVDGYNDADLGSNQPAAYSFDPFSPTTIRREIGSFPTPGTGSANVVWTKADEGFVVYDAMADIAYICPLKSDYDARAFPLTDEPETPIYVSGNQIKFSGNVTTKYAAGKALIVYLNHSTGGVNTPKRGRISASSFDGSFTTVTLDWFDTNLTMSASNPPTRLRAQITPAEFGGWEASEPQVVRYNESTQKWMAPLVVLDPSTRLMTEVLFETTARTVAANARFKNAAFIPAAATASGHPEIHCFGLAGTSSTACWIWDLTARTLTAVALNAGVSINNGSLIQTWPAFDGARYIYTYAFFENRLLKWDVRTRTTVWTAPITYAGKPLTGNGIFLVQNGVPTHNGPGPALFGEPAFSRINHVPVPVTGTDLVWLFWNSELNLLEFWRSAEGFGDIWFLDPAKHPTMTEANGAVQLVATRDQNGLDIRTWDPQHIPAIGGNQERTLCVGGTTFDTKRSPPPDKLRVFIGGNLKWQTMTLGTRFYNTYVRGDPAATEATPIITTNKIQLPPFGAFVEEMSGTGAFTGKLFLFGGGDADYAGNCVTQIRLDQISGSTIPLQTNLSTSAAAAAQWRNRVRATSWREGGTGQQEDFALNPSDLTDFQPMGIHTWGMNSFIPGVGMVLDFYAPISTIPDATFGTHPRILRANQLVPPVKLNPKVQRQLIAWSDIGANAGKWVRLVDRSAGPERDLLAEWNPSIGKLVGFYTPGSGSHTQVWDWAPGQSSITNRGNATISYLGNSRGLVYSAGGHASSAWWLEGTKYLLICDFLNGDGVIPWAVLYDHANPASQHTLLRGANGNSVLDAVGDQKKYFSAAVDRANRLVYWFVGVETGPYTRYFAPFRLYKSSFDDLTNFTEVLYKNRAAEGLLDSSTGIGFKYAAIHNGYIYLISKGGSPAPGGMPDQEGKDAGNILRLPQV